MISIDELERAVTKFNKSMINFSNINENVIRVDTPFYDRHNDSIILYISMMGKNNIKISDAGYIMDDLESDGIILTRSKQRMSILKKQLTSFSVQFDESTNELYILSTTEDYPVRQNLLIQAMLFVNDMFVLGNRKVASIFINEVANFFESENIRVTNSPNVIGTSGMIHHFDFSIPGIRDIPEKLIKVMNTPNNEYYAKAVAMDMTQARRVRENTAFYTFINDEHEIDNTIINLFESEKITPIPFSKREKYVAELAK